MRILGLIIVAFSLAVLAAVLLQGRPSGGVGATSDVSSEIRVTGPGNTLAGLLSRYGRPEIFEYDPRTRTAIGHVTIVIEGELTLGREGDPSVGETLELDTQVCGDLRLEVRRGGVLRLFHSNIRTVSQVLSNGACSRGYALFIDGELVMKDSRISYISGSTSQCLRGEAKATILRSVFSYCDGSALSCVNVDGARIHIEGCDFHGSGNWGVVVQGQGGAPLEIRDSLLDARVGGVFVSGRSASVRLVDCVFDPAKLVFNQDSGEVAIAWTRRVRVIDPRTRTPLAGVLVRAESETGTQAIEPVEARTDAQGLAELVLVERIARPGAAETACEHVRYRLRVQGPGGELRAERKDLTVKGKDREPLVVEAS